MTTTPATTAHPTAPKSARVSAAPRAGRATDQFAKAMRRAERDTQAFNRKHHAQDSGNAFLDSFKKPNVHFVGLNAPYMDPEADVVLRSNDGVDFRVHSDALSGTSEAFKDMLTAPPPSSSGATTSHASITHLRSADSTTPTTQPPAQATTPPHSPAPVQPPIDIEAPALILRHFCDLLTNNTLLPLDHDEREEQSTIYHSRTGSTMVHIPTPRGMLELRRSLQDGHKRRLWRKWQIPKGDVRSPRQGSQGASGMELDGTEGPRGNGQHTLSDDSGPLQPPTTSQHFTDLFRSPSLRGPGAGIARLTALLDLVERFDCSSALLQRALGHYHQSIPRDPWGAFVLFATRGDVERAKVAITHFDKTVKAHREHVRSQGLGPGTRSGRSRKVKGEEAKRTPGQIADGLEAVKREKEGYAFMVDPQNLTVERAAQVPLGCYMGYVRAFDKWRSTQGVVSDEQLRNGSNIDWQYIADNFDPVA